MLRHQWTDLTQIACYWFRFMLEEAVGIAVVTHRLTLKRLKQFPPQRPSCPAVGVEENTHLPGTDTRHIYQFQHSIPMPVFRAPAFTCCPQFIPRHPAHGLGFK